MLDHFEKIRRSYLFPEGPKILIGDKGILRDHFIHLNKEEFIEKTDDLQPSVLWVYEEITALDRDNFTDFILNVQSIRSLKFCNDYLPLAGLPSANVRAINLLQFIDKELLDRSDEFSWRADQIVPHVEFFSFLDFDGRYDLAGISPVSFPGLKWIECFVDKKGRTLDTVQGFSNLTTAYLHHVRKHDVFTILQGLGIKMLKLEGFDRGFSFKNIGRLFNLEVLHLNGYRENLDLRLLADLPLKEVYLLNCPRLDHSEVLLQIPTLDSVHIINCKKPLSDAVKMSLKEKMPLANVDFQ